MREIELTEEETAALDELLEMPAEMPIYRADGTVGTITRAELLGIVVDRP